MTPTDDLIERLIKPSGTSWIDAERGHAAARIREQEAEIARLRYQLRWRAEDVGATHYPECWRDHYACAIARIEQAEAERDAVREILADHERLWREQDAAQASVIDAAKAMRPFVIRGEVDSEPPIRAFDAALAALEGDK